MKAERAGDERKVLLDDVGARGHADGLRQKEAARGLAQRGAGEADAARSARKLRHQC